MTRKEFDTIVAGLTDERLADLSFVETAALEAHVLQANAADARAEVYTAALTLDKDGNPVRDEKGNYVGGKLAVAEKTHADAIAKLTADHATALQQAADKAAQDAAAAKVVADADKAAVQAKLDTAMAEGAELVNIVNNALGTTDAGRKILAQQKLDALTKQAAEVEAAKQAAADDLAKMADVKASPVDASAFVIPEADAGRVKIG